ncbi:MAG: hypothetical protein KAT58_06485 [candidate division Zixibacteria bacterium]|nr:hypothetical protein [candidate division Zixibacteria bacterium]
MPQKLKSNINAIFVQMNRYMRQRKDFSARSFVHNLDTYFQMLDRVDISGERGAAIDEQLKLRINTVPRDAEPLVLAIADLMALDFWYIRRPGSHCSDSLVAAKKLRGQPDDSMFIEHTLAPLVFAGRIRGFGKYEYVLREILFRRAALVFTNFKESDQVPLSATRIIKSDTWQKKMLHISALHQAGRAAEIGAIAPREKLHDIYFHNSFARAYLYANKIYIPKNRLWLFIKKIFSNIFSVVYIPLNLRFVIHLFRNRWPVYLVYLALACLLIFGACKTKALWEVIHDSRYESLPKQLARDGERG